MITNPFDEATTPLLHEAFAKAAMDLMTGPAFTPPAEGEPPPMPNTIHSITVWVTTELLHDNEDRGRLILELYSLRGANDSFYSEEAGSTFMMTSANWNTFIVDLVKSYLRRAMLADKVLAGKNTLNQEAWNYATSRYSSHLPPLDDDRAARPCQVDQD